MQPAGKSAASGLMVPGASSAEPQAVQVADSRSGVTAIATKHESKKSSPDDVPARPLGSYQVQALPPLKPAAICSNADALARAHAQAQADAHLQAFIDAERESLAPRDRALFVEFLDHGEYGLAYDTAIDLMTAGCKWPEASLAHLKAAAQAMGIAYPRLSYR